MKLYCLQLNITWEDKPANHAKVRALLDSHPPDKHSLVLLPEMFSTGFTMHVDTAADDQTRADQTFLSQLAKDFSITVVAGIVTRDPSGAGLNQALICNPAGQEVARYTKLHTFSPGKESQHYRPGSEVITFNWQGLKVCPFICYDLRFPEIFRHATQQGAHLFTLIANWPSTRTDHWLTLAKARAIENQAYVATTNRTGNDPHLPYPGRSQIVDPQGTVIADAGATECIIEASIDPTTVTQWRTNFPVLQDIHPNFSPARRGQLR